MLSIHDVYRPFLLHFRRARMELLHEQFGVSASTRVLDVGGTAFNWALAPVMPDLTILNIGPRPADLPAGIAYVQGDARDMSWARDGCFDLVYSNSVIEHLGDIESQRRMANEIRRLGRSYFIQTPDPRFFIEPHLLTPCIHFFPPPRPPRAPAQCDRMGMAHPAHAGGAGRVHGRGTPGEEGRATGAIPRR